MSGVRTTNLDEAMIVDDLLGNKDGGSVRVPFASLATQLAVVGALGGYDASVTSFAELVTRLRYSGATGAQINVVVGAYIRDKSTGRIYQVLDPETTNPDHDYTGTGGVKLSVVLTLCPEVFSTFERACEAASATGRPLVGTPGTYYSVSTGVVNASGPLTIIMNGCEISSVNGSIASDAPILHVVYPFSAATYGAAMNVTAFGYAPHMFLNGEIDVPHLTVADASQFAVGDIVKVLSSDRIPADPTYWPDYRYAESGEVAAVDIANNKIVLLQPFAEDWTPAKIVRYQMSGNRLRIQGGIWGDLGGFATNRSSAAIRVSGAIRPVFDGVETVHTGSIGILLRSCYEPVHRNCHHADARTDFTLPENAYGYGVLFVACTRPTSWSAYGDNLRHVVDTGSDNISDADLAGHNPDGFGGTIRLRVHQGRGQNCHNAPMGDHQDAFESIFYGCSADYAQPRSTGAVPWVAQLRGRGSAFVGGDFRGLCGIRVENATDIPSVISGGRFTKDARTLADGNRRAVIEIDGSKVTGGKRANVHIDASIYGQNGNAALVSAVNARVSIAGQLKVRTSANNPKILEALSGSEFIIDGNLEVDLTEVNTTTTVLISALVGAGTGVSAPGRIIVRGNPGIAQAVALADFGSSTGKADFRDVTLIDCAPFSNAGQLTGFRNSGSATLKRLVLRKSGGENRAVRLINFATPDYEGKPIVFPEGMGETTLVLSIRCTAIGSWVSAIPNGNVIGQTFLLYNSGYHAFEISQNTLANVSTVGGGTPGPADKRSVAPATAITGVWDGTFWVC